MVYIFMVIFAVLAVVADQVTKYLTVANIELGGALPAIPGLFDFTYVQNTGAAWSSFEGQHWLFALIFVAFAAFLAWDFAKNNPDAVASGKCFIRYTWK